MRIAIAVACVAGCTTDITSRWEDCGCTGAEICVDDADGRRCIDPPATCANAVTCDVDACTDSLEGLCPADGSSSVECEVQDQQDAVRLVECG
ncbi:MAG: hypothetical protein AAF602_10255 [Myxococcota bacterium]